MRPGDEDTRKGAGFECVSANKRGNGNGAMRCDRDCAGCFPPFKRGNSIVITAGLQITWGAYEYLRRINEYEDASRLNRVAWRGSYWLRHKQVHMQVVAGAAELWRCGFWSPS